MLNHLVDGEFMKYNESKQSKNLMKLNNDYIELFNKTNSCFWKKRNLKKLNYRIIINKIIYGYYFKDKLNNRNKLKTFKTNPIIEEKREVDTNDRIAIYTVIIGDYDSLKEPLYISDQCDYYVITDKMRSKKTCWKTIDINKFDNLKSFSNTKKARYAKTHPEIFFKDYKYTIFVDGNIQIISDLIPLIEKMGHHVFATHLHPLNNCIYEEGRDIITFRKATKYEVNRQLNYYKKMGFPKRFGLFETNVLVREHNNDECKNIDRQWWSEMEKFSLRDQLSLTYVLWNNKYKFSWIGILGNNPRTNPRIRYLPHKE